jgi:hypothetical protein
LQTDDIGPDAGASFARCTGGLSLTTRLHLLAHRVTIALRPPRTRHRSPITDGASIGERTLTCKQPSGAVPAWMRTLRLALSVHHLNGTVAWGSATPTAAR